MILLLILTLFPAHQCHLNRMEDPQAQLEKEKIIELYQNTTLAKCLADELQEQIDQNKITVRDAQKIMEIFDNQLYEQMQLFSQQQSRIEGTVSVCYILLGQCIW